MSPWASDCHPCNCKHRVRLPVHQRTFRKARAHQHFARKSLQGVHAPLSALLCSWQNVGGAVLAWWRLAGASRGSKRRAARGWSQRSGLTRGSGSPAPNFDALTFCPAPLPFLKSPCEARRTTEGHKPLVPATRTHATRPGDRTPAEIRINFALCRRQPPPH